MQLTLTDAAVRGSTHVKACVAAAVLLLVHLDTARTPAEGRIVHDAPLGWCCVRRRADELGQTHTTTTMMSTPTCLGLVLAERSTPPLRAGAPVPMKPFHTGTSILAGIAGTLAHDCR